MIRVGWRRVIRGAGGFVRRMLLYYRSGPSFAKQILCPQKHT